MKEKTTIKKLTKFFSLIKYNKKDYFLHFIQSIIRGMNPLVHIFFIEKIVYILTIKDIGLLKTTLIYYIIALLSFEFLWFITRKIGWVVTLVQFENYIYDMCLNKFIQMDNNSIEKMGIGKIIAILENGRLRWADALANVTEKGVALLILLIYVFFVTSKHGLIYTLCFFALLVCSITVLVLVNKNQFKYRNKRSELRNNRLRLVTKVLMSKNEILQTGRINSEIEKISKLCDETSKVNIEMANGRMVQNRFITFFIGISLFFFASIFGKEVISGSMEMSQFVAITSIFLVVNSSIISFLQFYIDLTKDFIDIEKMWDFFDNTPLLAGYENGNDFVYKNGDIKLENIDYGYTKGQNIFSNFNLDIKGGKITALVGNSGGGKSTLVKLISGYIKADSGNIIIDCQSLGEVSLKSYYKYIGYLPQEPSVFDGTVIDNLTYAINRNVSKEELEKVIKLAVCDFIYDLPRGVETQIGEKGIRLSGGQRQRLAIAKIMLKDPKIIILDEPTSALDSFSEELITKAMNNLFEGRTVLVIAHRLQTVKHADEIIVIENGEIQERGNHNELVEKNGIYNRMLELQSGF